MSTFSGFCAQKCCRHASIGAQSRRAPAVARRTCRACEVFDIFHGNVWLCPLLQFMNRMSVLWLHRLDFSAAPAAFVVQRCIHDRFRLLWKLSFLWNRSWCSPAPIGAVISLLAQVLWRSSREIFRGRRKPVPVQFLARARRVYVAPPHSPPTLLADIRTGSIVNLRFFDVLWASTARWRQFVAINASRDGSIAGMQFASNRRPILRLLRCTS